MRLLSLVAIVLLTPSLLFAADAAAGKTVYDTRCSSCHGATGGGDGPAAANLPPAMKPRNLSAGEFKFATDDAKFKQLLQEGGAKHGLSPLMAPQAGLTDADLDNVIAYVHSLKK